MNELIKLPENQVAYNQTEIMPYGQLGKQIDWAKVFNQTIGVFYPKSIDWNKSTNQDGEFDTDAFILSRTNKLPAREKYLKIINKKLAYWKMLKEKEALDEIYIRCELEDVIKAFQDMFFLGKENSEVYSKTFFIQLEGIYNQLKANNAIAEDNELAIDALYNEIKGAIQEGLEWEAKEWPIYIKNYSKISYDMAHKYIKSDGSLDVGAVLNTVNGVGTWNEESMLIAFFNAKSSKEEIQRLQEGVIKALDNKMKRLDTYKVFVILERILPYIFEGVDIKFELPEIFRPEYLSHIGIYDLTLENFTDQVHHKGKNLGRSDDIQNKLIEQFKTFGQNENGKIGFGQGSEQLRYWNGVTTGVTPQNYTSYLKDENFGKNTTLPKILRREDKKDDLIELLK